jgi:hypothetical protein
MATAADVPNKYDVLINSVGYMFAEVEDVKAEFGYTPTFVPRSNTQGDFGDNQQDFWLSVSQNNWTLGEQQRFYRADETSRRRYWSGVGIDIETPGEVVLRNTIRSITAAAAVQGVAAANRPGSTPKGLFSTTTNLYTVASDGTVTDLGAHSAGGSGEALLFDGDDFYVTSGSGTDIRKNQAGVYSTFSADQMAHIEYLNNTLFGSITNSLYRFDTAGVSTLLYQWKSSDGSSAANVISLRAYGGKLLILVDGPTSYELWLYDGTGTARVANFPSNFNAQNEYGLNVIQGVVYIGGHYYKPGSFERRGALFAYVNGTLVPVWRASTFGSSSMTGPRVAPFDDGVVFTDDARGYLMKYTPATGGVHAVGSFTAETVDMIAGCGGFVLLPGSSTTLYQYPTSTCLTSGTLTTSLFDFDSSLEKIFRGVKVEFDSASDGNGGSVDIAYRVGDLDGSYTTLQSSGVSGTEYLLSDITGRSISIRVTLNKGTSTAGPKLKRISVRAVPKQSSFRKETFVIQCTGRDGDQPLQLRDGSFEVSDGLTLATALRTAATTTNPISITDEFGTFTGVIELDGFQLRRVRPNEFIAIVPVRGV